MDDMLSVMSSLLFSANRGPGRQEGEVREGGGRGTPANLTSLRDDGSNPLTTPHMRRC